MKELSNDVLVKAADGDGEALDTVLRRYDAYINAYSTEVIFSDSGRRHFAINEDWKSCIVLRVTESVLRWRALPDDDSAR